jgi:hypothetical protein
MEQGFGFRNLDQGIRQRACIANTSRVVERSCEAEVIVKHTSLGYRPALSCGEVFLVSLICQSHIDVSMEKS